MAHKKVKLNLPGDWTASQGKAVKTKPPTLHFNGNNPVNMSVSKVISHLAGVSSYHMQPGVFEAKRQNGAQYHSAVFEDTVYLMRDPLSILYHCGNYPYNHNSHAIYVPQGGWEKASKRTLQTLEEWVDEICDTWKIKRSVVGHKELSSTECPRTLMDDFVYPYRQGRSFGGGSTAKRPVSDDPKKQPELGERYSRLVVASIPAANRSEKDKALAEAKKKGYKDAWFNTVKL